MSTKYTMTIGTFVRDVSGPHNAAGYTGNTPKSGIEKYRLSLDITVQLIFKKP